MSTVIDHKANLSALLTEEYYDLRHEDDTYSENGSTFKVVHVEHVTKTRWANITEVVAKCEENSKFYRWTVSEGATEMQESEGFGEDIEVVVPREKVIIEYVKA